MEWMNYHHLLYFWHVVREGGILPASKVLKVSHPTISAQIKQLERALGEALFDRRGRRLELTEMGRTVHRYADEIFMLGRELMDAVKGRPVGRPLKFVVGITEVMPKLLIKRLLEPLFRMPESVYLVCEEDRFDRLLGKLARHGIDLLLTDAPLPPGSGIKAFNHPLGECGITFFCAPELASDLRGRFPKRLNGAPFLLPAEGTVLRRSLEQWFLEKDIRPGAWPSSRTVRCSRSSDRMGRGYLVRPASSKIR